MTNDTKHKILLLLLPALVATTIVAVALPQLELKPGIPLPQQGDIPEGTIAEQPTVSISGATYLSAILVAVIIVVFVVVVGGHLLYKGISWRKISWLAVLLAILTPIILGALFALINIRVSSDPLGPETLPPELTRDGPPLAPLPNSLIWLVWIGLVVLIGFLGVSAIRRAAQQTHAYDLVGFEAEQAMRDLKTGLGLKNVIVRCYQQMSLALQKEQGIELEETMTAREFERLLTARGVPYAPVHQLTQLFEGARYSLRPSTSDDEQLAFECLDAIVRHSRERRQIN